MYDIKFATPSGADWAEIIEAIDDDTNRPLSQIDGGLIELQVRDRCDAPVLTVSTDDGTITRPTSGQFQWRIPKERMSGLCIGTTYRVGCRITLDGQTTNLFTGDLAYIDGEFK